ncbi:CRTAC1 family protein [Shewanella sp. CG12_big_fil_rev_8_21_14_0_65_47_15]|uniref:CRTAC1 family protein n=1 Tax=Shewanella sp. CG12_big_fil_rev_8_21_14_0_65_47_15 TaxID=1975537 RepID=UPI0025D13392|nr:CRTAC1 family protein [Shewanella sp. CG12_big_fil_rev_8_21_14_0_65_47_15]
MGIKTFTISAVTLSVLLSMATSIAETNPNMSVTDLPVHDEGLLRLMGKLESVRDPKCHATATRLEGLIYGTPLSDAARYAKAEYQKHLIREIWLLAAKAHPSAERISLSDVKPIVASLFTATESKDHWTVTTPKASVVVDSRDQKHYGSIAYSFRAMLAVQQDALLDMEVNLPPLADDAVEFIRGQLDLVTLSLLKEADLIARGLDEYEVSEKSLSQSWARLFPEFTDTKQSVSATTVSSGKTAKTGLLNEIVDLKIAAFQQYNQVNQTLFSRNLQVYFAKLALPKDAQKSAEFTRYFTEAMVAFAGSFYLQSQAAVKQGQVIKEADVDVAMDNILPHSVNEYEDVIFYPNYPYAQQIEIEAYDMDSFRDSGLHWFYLKEALADLGDRVTIEADPFAAELLTEAIAHYGVLLLRAAGEEGKAKGASELDASFVTAAYNRIAKQVDAYHQYVPEPVTTPTILSASTETDAAIKFFTNVTDKQHINIEHRSSDWLSRQLRSYLNKDTNTGIITIPPAFGGGGVAAEDINGDGLTDLLVLSGVGNKLYVNRGDVFEDVTVKSGLSNVSQRAVSQGNAGSKVGGLAGEPRQPLIADFDNDGDQDIMITYVDEPHRIYSNNGDGTFTEKTEIAKLGGAGHIGGPATTFDVNNDGLLDIYIEYFGNYLTGSLPTLKRRNDNGEPNELFINKGNFVFEKAEDALGANNSGWGQAVTHTDLNMDGWQDLIVGNDFGVNAYYINQQGKGFVDYAAKIGTSKPSYTMNLSLSDLNGDGLPDVYVSNIVTMNKDQKYVLPSEDTQAQFNPDKLANMRVVEGNDLFISGKNANGALRYQASDKIGRGYSSTGWAWDADFFDVDNDGDEDLYVLNGMNDYYVYSSSNPYYSDPNTGEAMTGYFPDAAKASNVFFLNTNGGLSNVSERSGLDFVANSRSAAYLDFDNDGDLDVIVNNYHDKAQLFENQANTLNNHWLKIRLIGSPENGVNLDGIGAQIIVGYGDKGYSWRQVSGSQGYMSVHPKEQSIGLGKSTLAKVVIIWPNGKRQRLNNVKANQAYTVKYEAKAVQ